MQINIVPIGNSLGIRIPKTVLKQCGLVDKVDMIIDNNHIIIKPIEKLPRQGWTEEAKMMSELGEDALLDEESLEYLLNNDDWEW